MDRLSIAHTNGVLGLVDHGHVFTLVGVGSAGRIVANSLASRLLVVRNDIAKKPN